jgi:hypothetical protein
VSGVQLPLGSEVARDGLPVDPAEVASLTTPERGRLYDELGLDFEQRQACEDACRLVLAGRYRGAAP